MLFAGRDSSPSRARNKVRDWTEVFSARRDVGRDRDNLFPLLPSRLFHFGNCWATILPTLTSKTQAIPLSRARHISPKVRVRKSKIMFCVAARKVSRWYNNAINVLNELYFGAEICLGIQASLPESSYLVLETTGTLLASLIANSWQELFQTGRALRFPWVSKPWGFGIGSRKPFKLPDSPFFVSVLY